MLSEDDGSPAGRAGEVVGGVSHHVRHHRQGGHTTRQLRRVQLIQGVAVTMVIPEIPSPVDVETEPRYATVHQGFDIGLRRLGFSNDVAGPDGCEERAYLLQADQSGIRSTEAKAVWAEGSVIGLDGEDVPGQIAFVRVSIREGASATVFLIGPEHHTDGTARPEPKPAHQADGFPGSNGAATVIHGTLTTVPEVDVSAEHHDFIGPLSPAQPGNDSA